eukprot:5492150-Alexandrium_andersonii.AAC.1
MSASLVGSEMCIRDRTPCAHGFRQRAAGGISVGRFLPTAFMPAAAATMPVSYTHLTLPTICSV